MKTWVFVSLVVLASIFIFSIPWILYNVHEDEMTHDFNEASCPLGTTPFGCHLCSAGKTDDFNHQKYLPADDKELGIGLPYHLKMIPKDT